jgi:2-oxoglutarate dehydrogenase E1 component
VAIVPDESSTSASEVDFGANDWLLEEMYERYTTDPSSVDETWAKYFKSHGAPSTVTGDGAAAGTPEPTADTGADPDSSRPCTSARSGLARHAAAA